MLYAYTQNNPVMYVDPSGYKCKLWDWIVAGVVATACIVAIAVSAPVLLGLGAVVGIPMSAGVAISLFTAGTIVGAKMITIGKAQYEYSRSRGASNSKITNDIVKAISNFSKDWFKAFTITESTSFIFGNVLGLGKEFVNFGVDIGATPDVQRIPDSNGNLSTLWSASVSGWISGQTFVAMTDSDLCFDLAKKYGWTPE